MFRALALRATAFGLLGLGLYAGVQLPAVRAAAESKPAVSGEAADDDATYLEAPPFPGVEFARALRLQAQSGFLPAADLGLGQVDLYRPQLRARLSLPINARAVARLNGRIGMSHYQFSGSTPFKSVRDPLDLYSTRLALEGAYQLTDPGESWLVEGESWSLLGGLSGESSWEGSRIDAGFSGGVALGFGYRLPGRFRLALGAKLQSNLDEGGVDVGPFASFRWSITDALTLRDRGLGLLLEYRLSKRVELFATGFRTSESFRLKNRFNQNDLTFRDRRIQAGAGIEWRITRYFRLNLEVGGIVDRKLRVHSSELETLFSQRADPSAYVDLRFELRPGRI